MKRTTNKEVTHIAGKSLPYTQPTSETEVSTPRVATAVRKPTSVYEVFDVPTHGFQPSAKIDPSAAVGRIVARGTSLKEVLSAARLHLATDKQWKGKVQIEIRVNNNSPWKVTALHMKVYGEKLLVHSFGRRLMLYRYAE